MIINPKNPAYRRAIMKRQMMPQDQGAIRNTDDITAAFEGNEARKNLMLEGLANQRDQNETSLDFSRQRLDMERINSDRNYEFAKQRLGDMREAMSEENTMAPWTLGISALGAGVNVGRGIYEDRQADRYIEAMNALAASRGELGANELINTEALTNKYKKRLR